MANRSQRRHRAILPVKIITNGNVLVGHTLDISAHGAKIVVLSDIPSGTEVKIDYKHRRVTADVVWCRPAAKRKYEYELGLRLRSAHVDFWGVVLSERDPDTAVDSAKDVPANVISMLSPKARAAD